MDKGRIKEELLAVWMKCITLLIIPLTIGALVLLCYIPRYLEQINAQQRQIDSIYDATFLLAKEQGVSEISGFIVGRKYCLFLADYNRHRAILYEFDGEISYNKKPRLVIMRPVNKKTLEYWEKQPIIYELYKEIQ